MPNIKAPQYSKILNSRTGVNDPCYTFSIEYTSTDKSLPFVADNESDINLQNLQKTATGAAGLDMCLFMTRYELEITRKLKLLRGKHK